MFIDTLTGTLSAIRIFNLIPTGFLAEREVNILSANLASILCASGTIIISQDPSPYEDSLTLTSLTPDTPRAFSLIDSLVP